MKANRIKSQTQHLLMLVAFVITLTFAGFLLINRGGNQESNSAMLSNLSSADCVRACWLEIEPGITTGEKTRKTLENASINFDYVELPGGGGIYNLFFSDDKDDVGAISVIWGDIVSQIMLPLDACVSRIVAVYGTPDEVQESGIYITLLYAAKGLVFNVDTKDRTRAASVFLTSEAVFEANFSGETVKNNWDEFKERFTGACEDNTTALST